MSHAARPAMALPRRRQVCGGLVLLSFLPLAGCGRKAPRAQAVPRDATVLAQLPTAFEHFNEVHPHSSLEMRSPREYRRHQAAQARCSTVKDAALRCE